MVMANVHIVNNGIGYGAAGWMMRRNECMLRDRMLNTRTCPAHIGIVLCVCWLYVEFRMQLCRQTWKVVRDLAGLARRVSQANYV